jgi:tetratricopeptide (TPR) repeat protein
MTYPIVKYPFFLVSTAIALVCFVDVAVAKTPDEIKFIAQSVTVEINLKQAQSIGSGVLIYRQGDVYTLITNHHVICGQTSLCSAPSPTETYQLKFADGFTVEVDANAVKVIDEDLDLALIQFNSDRPHQVAKVAEPESLKAGDRVYISGYPEESHRFLLSIGKAMAVVDKRLPEDNGGYTMLYSAATQPGMSGGGVFNEDGSMIAIHGLRQRFRRNTILPDLESNDYVPEEMDYSFGISRGIPVYWVIRCLAKLRINLMTFNPSSSLSPIKTNTADEYFIIGFNKFVDPGRNFQEGKQQAIEAFSQAIRLKPRYINAYFTRAIAYSQIKKYQLALADYDRTLAIDPNVFAAYINRGTLKNKHFKDSQGALADFNQSIIISPLSAIGYSNRADIKSRELNDLQGAIRDYDQAILLSPQSMIVYYKRGVLRSRMGDILGAFTDYNQTILLNPNFAQAYTFRGILKVERLNDISGALADFDRAIALYPQDAIAYNNRGKLKDIQLNDFQGALADFDRAIALDPIYGQAYTNRGNIKAYKLNDFPGALADFDRAIVLNSPDAITHNNRANLKAYRFNDFQGALADFDRAIVLNPNFGQAYYERGILKTYKLRDSQGALADFDRAIVLNPQDTSAYRARGTLKYDRFNDRAGGIADIQTVIRLAKSQNNYQLLNSATKQLQSWGVNTGTDAY